MVGQGINYGHVCTLVAKHYFSLKKKVHLCCRYIAVHHPLNYSQTSNDCQALKGRMAKYLGPVSAFSLLLNVTKFFEATYVYRELKKEKRCSWTLPIPDGTLQLTS